MARMVVPPPSSRRPPAGVAALVLGLVALILNSALLEAQKPAGDSPGTGSGTVDVSKGATGKIGTFGVTSTKSPFDAVSTPPPGRESKETLYSTDANTDLLERAIERFNREKCPPQTPITEINRRTLRLLSEMQLIPSDISRFEKMVLRNGKVFKPVEQKPSEGPPTQSAFPTGKVPDSLLGVIDVVAEGLHEKSPLGSGTPAPPKDVRLEERHGTFRNANGELVEFKYWVPKVPGKATQKFTGKIQRVPTDTVQKTLLPPKYNSVSPTMDKAVPSSSGQ